jgi:hypothetical protein
MIDLRSLRMMSYNRTLSQLMAVAGVKSVWQVNLQAAPSVRSLALAGRLDRLECLVASAKVQASKAGLRTAAAALKAKERELGALRTELRAFEVPSADIVVLDGDWGKKGRGAKILAWIREAGADVDAVMQRFQLARSTSRKYLRRAKEVSYRMAA